MKQERVRWVVRVIREIDRMLQATLHARRIEEAPPARSDEDERELRVCRDTLRAALDALESLAAELQQQTLRYGELLEFVPSGYLQSSGAGVVAAPCTRRALRQASTKRDRIDWLLTAIHAVEDLVHPKLEARQAARKDASERELDEELATCLEELRGAAEELAQLRNRLTIERQRYVELLESTPEAYLEIDARGTVQEANRAAAALLGCEEEPLVGKPLAAFVAEGLRADLRRRMFSLTENAGGGAFELETCIQPRGGPALRARLRAASARDAGGRVQGARCLVRPLADGPRESG
ncbi:MAG TPA: PAS domain-containing protein [Burkholderiales bacterium]|nr:PAS domain-containing protein [Burkholderiales bacterium]